MLTGNLGDKLIPQNEILRDVSDLKALANLHESMEWLACRLKTFFANLPHASSEYKAVTSLDDEYNVTDTDTQTLTYAVDFVSTNSTMTPKHTSVAVYSA